MSVVALAGCEYAYREMMDYCLIFPTDINIICLTCFLIKPILAARDPKQSVKILVYEMPIRGSSGHVIMKTSLDKRDYNDLILKQT
ncbi:MAG: hypothetical protein QXT06_05765 [Candidatus Bathyarchaeia archaeon]